MKCEGEQDDAGQFATGMPNVEAVGVLFDMLVGMLLRSQRQTEMPAVVKAMAHTPPPAEANPFNHREIHSAHSSTTKFSKYSPEPAEVEPGSFTAHPSLLEPED